MHTYTILRVSSPPSFAFNSSSTSRFSPIANLAGFLPPPPPPFFGIGGSPLPLLLLLMVVTLASELAFLLLLRRRRRLRPLLLVVPAESLLNTEAVSEMRSPDMSILSWLPVPPPVPVVPVGTGPPGPPRRRRGCEVVLATEELCLGREAVSGEDIFSCFLCVEGVGMVVRWILSITSVVLMVRKM